MKGTVLNLQFRILCPSESPHVLAWAIMEIDGFGSLFLYSLYFPWRGFLYHHNFLSPLSKSPFGEPSESGL